MVEAGQPAPDFTLSDQHGQPVTLSQLRGTPVVLYFYPKDDTPGCTKEACAFRDARADYEEAGAKVIGVSPDTPASHKKFAEKYELPFTLVADPEKTVCQSYGVWKEKNMYGKKSMGVERTTFVIDGDGDRPQGLSRVKVDGHSDAGARRARRALWRVKREPPVPRSADARAAAGCGRSAWPTLSVEVGARLGQVVFELAEGLVLLVADAGDGQVQRLADLGDGPAAGPELDDPILARGQDGLPGGFEDLAEFLAVAVAAVEVGTGRRTGRRAAGAARERWTRLRTMSMARTSSRRSGVSSARTRFRSSWPARALPRSRQQTSWVQSSQRPGSRRAFRQQTVQ